MQHVFSTPVPARGARNALREVAARARRKLNEVHEPSDHIADSLGHPLPDLR